MDKAHHGNTLLVSGTCEENIVIRVSQISLIGTGGARIEPADPNTNTVDVEATNVRIRGFTIEVGGSNQNGIIVHRGGSARIERNTITPAFGSSATTGVLVTDNSYARIGGGNLSQGNTITGHRRGINVRLSAGADIFFNTFDENENGININNGGAADISDNTISNSDRGLSVSSNGSAALSGSLSSPGGENTFNKNGFGIWCALAGVLNGKEQFFGTGGDVNTISDQAKFSSCRTGSSLGAFDPLT